MLSLQLVAGSTGVITASFTDEDGTAVAPNTVTYSLVKDGSIVNNKEDISITPATSVNIVLSGLDLVAGTTKIIINGTYDSTYGNNLPLKMWECFEVIDVSGEVG